MEELVKREIEADPEGDAGPSGIDLSSLTIPIQGAISSRKTPRTILKTMFPFSDLGEDVEEQYIEEDRDTEARRSRKASQRVQQAVLKMLRDELGVDDVLDETIRKEFILQVCFTTIDYVAIIFINLKFYDSESHYYHPQGLRRLRIGSKPQEAAGHYNYEGWTRMYVACAGTDTQKLVNMLESMFGDGEDIEIEDLDSDDIQKLRAEAYKAEEEAMRKQGRVSAFNKTIIVKSLPLTPEFGIDDDYWPELIPVHKWDDKEKEKVDKLYYHCRICRKHESQNWASMLTHTWHCMKIFLVCGACDKSYLSVKGLADHVASVHKGILDPSKVPATSMQAE